MEDKRDLTLIVGAGVAGLTAGYLLAKAGKKCLIVEKEAVAGGQCRSFILDDIIFDLGPHVLFPNPGAEAEDFIFTLLKDEPLITRIWKFGIVNGKKSWTMPAGILELLFYPWIIKKQILLSYLKKGQVNPKELISAESDITAKFGPVYYNEVLGPMIHKKALMTGDLVHADWIARVDRDIHHRKEPFRDPHVGGILHKVKYIFNAMRKKYVYPANGFQTIADKLLQRYKEAGGELILNCKQLEFEKTEDKITAVIVDGNKHSVENVVWSASANQLNTLLGNDSLKFHYADITNVFLTYKQKRRKKRPLLYVYYTDPSFIFKRVYYPSNIFGDKTPDEKEGICVTIHETSEIAAMTDTQLVDKCVSDIESAGIFKAANLRKSKVVRLGNSMPLYSLDYETELQRNFMEIDKKYKNLYSIGRLGGFFFCMTPPAVSQGIKLTNHLLKGHER
ncbi:protoporphyrinogen/coproporphyrinogen oxidase [Candidatus Magnetomonas plexicatena]|uniref:protoporphyrinogen/coproporphyrinogen oxidase n=1 Tax=Candidatus Magnetomonas plexicatena TaxID=2552947 RepID=UPI001C7877F2|nr:NAD(P)-binding protein [Nitrospirales bacterium LBB_01]